MLLALSMIAAPFAQAAMIITVPTNYLEATPTTQTITTGATATYQALWHNVDGMASDMTGLLHMAYRWPHDCHSGRPRFLSGRHCRHGQYPLPHCTIKEATSNNAALI